VTWTGSAKPCGELPMTFASFSFVPRPNELSFWPVNCSVPMCGLDGAILQNVVGPGVAGAHRMELVGRPQTRVTGW
jgi:hypothetical protein